MGFTCVFVEPMKRFLVISILTLIGAVACSKKEEPPPQNVVRPLTETLFPVERVANGAKLFQQYCAECHGPDAQGHPDWQNPKLTAAPPLNGEGHAHQRTQQQLVMIVKQGARRSGKDVMPAWKGRLSDEEIGDIVIWFQALWPSDVYKQWQKANAGAKGPHG